MSSCNHLIKQQLEQILKDTKILCELEPFVKKWSLEETLPNFADDTAENSRHATISEILQTGQEAKSAPGENNSGEKILRKIKEVMSSPKSNNSLDDQYDSGCGHLIPSHQSYKPPDETLLGERYALELENTLMALGKIQAMDAVSPRDIEEYRRGLGGKPDGPEFDRTTMHEWKNVFLEQWLHLDEPSRYQKEAFIKGIIQRELAHDAELRSAVPILARTTLRTAEPNKCTSSRGSLDSSFMTMTKRGNKNITPSNTITLQAQKRPNSTLSSSSHSTYFPNPHHHHHHEQRNDVGKRAQTALEGRETSVLTLRGGSSKIETGYLEKETKGASSANKRMMMGMTVPPEYKKVASTSTGSKQLAGNVHYLEQGRATKKLVNKNNNKGWDAENTLRSSTAIKTNIETQRFKEKMGKARPSTSTPAPAVKPSRHV